jgi:phenolic acid decarboxylase
MDHRGWEEQRMDDKIIAAILATAMTDNRWTRADAVDLVRRYRAILEVLRTEPLPDATDVKPDIATD